ncbi:hypothetical protein B5X24_HaOG216268 [Helicoverpa armigera]|nr:hypothetical protein B5X24_HaOG216268 [Helicoverpa armigera]
MASNKCKATWNIIKDKHEIRYGQQDIKIIENGVLINDPLKIANLFNTFYIQKTNKQNNSLPNYNLINKNDSTIFLTPCDDDEVKKVIKSLKDTNAVGYDLISTNILKHVTEYKCTLFADDISVIVPDLTTTSDYKRILNDTVENIMRWLDQNNLTANISKTKVIKFRNYNSVASSVKLEYCGQNIEELDTTKFLGVLLDKNVNWKAQVANVCSRINKFVYALRKIRKLTCEKTALLAYHGYVLK